MNQVEGQVRRQDLGAQSPLHVLLVDLQKGREGGIITSSFRMSVVTVRELNLERTLL